MIKRIVFVKPMATELVKGHASVATIRKLKARPLQINGLTVQRGDSHADG